MSKRYYDLTRYVNDVNTENTEVLQEYTQSGSLKSSHIYGNERIYSDVYDPASDAFNVSTYNYDGRRSVAQTVTNAGIESQLSYDPFGNLISGETVGASTYGFNAEESNTLTGLQYLRARYYDTGGGRFITADDYLGDVKQPLTLNRYAYTANNPVKYNDPTGHFLGLAAYGIKRAVDHAVSTTKKAVNIVKKTNKFIGTSLKTAAAVTSMISPTVGRAVNSMADSYIKKSVNNGGGNCRAMSGKQKKSNYMQNVNRPMVETFVNMMGVGVQIAVGSSQIKRHLEAVKKKVVNYYCGTAEKIVKQSGDEKVHNRELYDINVTKSQMDSTSYAKSYYFAGIHKSEIADNYDYNMGIFYDNYNVERGLTFDLLDDNKFSPNFDVKGLASFSILNANAKYSRVEGVSVSGVGELVGAKGEIEVKTDKNGFSVDVGGYASLLHGEAEASYDLPGNWTIGVKGEGNIGGVGGDFGIGIDPTKGAHFKIGVSPGIGGSIELYIKKELDEGNYGSGGAGRSF